MKTLKMKMKNIFKSKIKNVILNSTRVKLKRKMKFIKIRTKTTKKLPKTFQFSNLKDFIFYKYICEMYIFADIKRNCRKSKFI